MSYEESFPLSPSGKRSIRALEDMGLINTFIIDSSVYGKTLVRK